VLPGFDAFQISTKHRLRYIPTQVVAVGFCMGGALSLAASALLPDVLDAGKVTLLQ